MKKYRLTVNGTLDAEDTVDALDRVIVHFQNMRARAVGEGEPIGAIFDYDSQIHLREVRVRVVEEELDGISG